MHLMPHNQLIRIKYFTAKLHPRPSEPDAPLRQAVYLRALATLPKVKRYILQASPSELCRRRAVRENTH
jgi:hypothetical protein